MVPETSGRTRVALLGVGSALGLLFLAAGLAKLAGTPLLEGLFDVFGLPRWAMYVVGGAEVVFATLIAIPRTRPYGAMGLAVVMAGAVLTRAFSGVVLPMMLLDAVLFIACVWVVREDRPPFFTIHHRDEHPGHA